MPQHADRATTETNFDVKASLSQNRLKGLWRLLSGYRRLYIAAILAMGLGAIANTGGLLLLRHLVDNVLKDDPAGNLLTALLVVAGAFFGLALIRGLFEFGSGALSARSAEGIALRLKDYMFDHLQHLSFTYHDKMQTGELIQRSTSDIDAVRRFFAEQAIGIGRIVLLFAVNFAALLYLHVPLALFTVLVVPIIAVMSLYFFRKVSAAYEAYQEQDEKVNNALQENLSGVRVVKAFARQPFEIDRFQRENHLKYERGLDFMKLHSMYWPVTDVITGFQMVAGYLFAALLVIRDGMTIGGVEIAGITLGTFVTYFGLVSWIINPMRNLGRLIVQMSTGMVSYDRLAEVMQEDWEDLGKEQTPPKTDIDGHIVFKNVDFRYRQGPEVLHDISFEAQPGQTIALLGSTGSGKTTLLSLLTRFYDYKEGQILLDGVDLLDYPRHFLRSQVGVVQQEPFLFSRTIRENITYGVHGEVTDEDVFEAARAAAVHDVILEFPNGYETAVGERGVTLSGGQKQRIALARTLLKNPKILVLDDATSSVDTETESEIRDALNRMMNQRTSFIVAHRIQSVMNADMILVLDDGRIVQRGTHDELMQVDGMYRKTYDMQARVEDELEREVASVRQ